MRKRFGTWLAAWDEFDEAVETKARDPAVSRICEVGAGANPLLPPGFVTEHGLDYVLLDASTEELAKADEAYTKIQGDAESADLDAGGPYDLVFSRFTAEHIGAPEAFHRNVHAMLGPGATALHFFPTLYAPAFVVNRLLPERLTDWMLQRVQGGREHEGHTGKFPAYYRWCRGPTRRQRERFERVGFEVEEYVGYFGHFYYDPIPVLRALLAVTARTLARHPLPLLTSYAYVSLRRPG